jgi:hypothetical protein
MLTPKPKSDYNLVIKAASLRDKILTAPPGDVSDLEDQLRAVIAEYKKKFPWKGPTKSMKDYWK